MQIDSVTLHQYEIPLEEPFVTALKPIPELERVLVEIETDNGLVGYGESAPAYEVTGETQRSTMAVLEDILAPLVIGSDPIAIERVTSEMRSLVDGAPSAHAGLEIAMQDVRGKRADLPLYRLLGGHAETGSINVPVVLSIKDPDEMAADAKQAVEKGYKQIKIKVGSDPTVDVARIEAIDEAVPDDVSLKADANQGWGDAKTSVSVLRDVQDRLDVIEQPVTNENIDDLAYLRRHLDVPVMPDESVETAADATKLIERNAGDLYNIKLMKTGGLTEAARLNAVAEAAGRSTQLGSMVEGHIGTAAGVHFVTAYENVVWNEMVGPFMTNEGITDLEYEVPEIVVDGPGLGVTVDHDRLDSLTSRTVVIE